MAEILKIAVVRTQYEFSGLKRQMEAICLGVVQNTDSVKFHMLVHSDYLRFWPKESFHHLVTFPWKVRLSCWIDQFFPTNRNILSIKGVARVMRPINTLLKYCFGLPTDEWSAFVESYLDKNKSMFDAVYYCQPYPKDKISTGNLPLAVLWADFSEDRDLVYRAELQRSYSYWFKAADKVIFSTNTMRKKAFENFPALEYDNSEVILMPATLGYAPPSIVARVRDRIPNVNNRLIGLLPSRSDPRKRHTLILNALNQLDSEGEESFVPVFCGPGTDEFSNNVIGQEPPLYYAHEVAQLAKDYGFDWGQRMHTLGLLDEIELYAVYEVSSFCIFPSIYEGLGMPILEAMKAGLPVLCSDLDVFKDELTALGLTAYIFEADNLQSLVDTIKKMVGEWDQALMNAEQNQKIVNELSWKKFADDYVLFFRSLVGNQQESLPRITHGQ